MRHHNSTNFLCKNTFFLPISVSKTILVGEIYLQAVVNMSLSLLWKKWLMTSGQKGWNLKFDLFPIMGKFMQQQHAMGVTVICYATRRKQIAIVSLNDSIN